MHQVAVLFSLADKTKQWTGVDGAFVEHQHLLKVSFNMELLTGTRMHNDLINFVFAHEAMNHIYCIYVNFS